MTSAENAALALPLIVGLCLIGVAALVGRTGWTHGHNRIYAALYSLSGLKSVSEGLLAGNPRWADRFHAGAPLFPDVTVWTTLWACCAFVMTPLLLHFVLVFPRPNRYFARRPALAATLYLPSMVLVLLFLLWPPWRATFDWTPVFLGFELAAVGATGIALYRLVRTWRRTPEAIERKQSAYLLAGFLPSFIITWILASDDLVRAFIPGVEFQTLHRVAGLSLIQYVSPVLEFLAAGLVAYAILKYRLLSVELQVKGGVKYVLMTLSLGTVLFFLNTYVGNFVLQAQVFSFAGPTGSAVLAGVSTVLLFKPVEKASGKVTDRLFPETVKDPKAYAKRRSFDIYRAQATYVLQDAQVTDRELTFLRALRTQLELTDAEAQAIEESVERKLGVDSKRTGLDAPPLASAQAHRGAAETAVSQGQSPESAGGPPAEGSPPIHKV